MALVPLREMNDIDPADRPAAEAGQQAFGRLLHTWQAIANRPGLLSVYLPFVRTLTGPGALDQRVKELVAIRVGALNHCRYTASHRCTSARAQGVTDDEMVAVANGDYSAFPERLRLALEFADAVTREVPVTSRRDKDTGIDKDLRSRVADQFSPDEIVELLMSISIWNGLARFHRVMDFEPDLPAAPQGVDDAL
jgi:AhpD family alkylhydroperoxidase